MTKEELQYLGVYSCDRGGLLVGNENFQVLISNGYGDGLHDVYLANSYRTLETDGYTYQITLDGKFNIYNYDCLEKREMNDERNIISSFDGWYFVFSKDGDIIFVKIKDYTVSDDDEDDCSPTEFKPIHETEDDYYGQGEY